MLATQVILCVTIIGNIALFTVALREKQSLTRVTFLAYVGGITAWAFFIFLNLFLRSLFVEQCIFASAAAMLTAEVWFAQLFSKSSIPSRLWNYGGIAIGCFFIQASFYPGALFHFIILHPHGYTILDTGYLSSVYSLFAFCYVAIPIVIFSLKYRRAKGAVLRGQLRYLLIGSAVFFAIALLTNSILPVFFHIYELNAIGPSFSLIYATCVFYIVARYEFLDIRAAIQRGVLYSFLIAIVIAAYCILIALADRDFSLDNDLPVQLSAAVAVMFGVLTIPVIEKYFQKATDRLFFKERYDYALALESLSRILTGSIDFNDLITELEANLAQILRAEFVRISLGESTTELLTADLGNSRGLYSSQTLTQPIYVDDKIIGTIIVGPKLSGDKYRAEDIRLLRTCSLQASTALARAQLFIQVQKHTAELEQKVIERTAQLSSAHEREQHMMQDIAHGLQTPLTIFRTQLEQLRLSEIAETELDTLDRSLVSISGFIENLLQLAHLEHTPSFTVKTECLLSDSLNDICDEIEIVATPKDISIVRHIAPNIYVLAEAKDLRAAIMNIVSNAIKYMRASSERKITFDLSEAGGNAVVVIKDTGKGIATQDIQYIFERFYRSDRQEIGGGLGLAISKKIIEQHGGSIEIQSDLGQGTTVSLSIPSFKKTEGPA